MGGLLLVVFLVAMIYREFFLSGLRSFVVIFLSLKGIKSECAFSTAISSYSREGIP